VSTSRSVAPKNCADKPSAILLLDEQQFLAAGVADPGWTKHASVLDLSDEAITAIHKAVEIMSVFQSDSDDQSCEQASPFLLHFVYKAAVMHLRMLQGNTDGPTACGFDALKRGLRQLSGRWLAASA
jgi:hypothetical protein